MATRQVPGSNIFGGLLRHLLFGIGGACIAGAFLLVERQLICATALLEMQPIVLAIAMGGTVGILVSVAFERIQRANHDIETNWRRITASLQIDETLRLALNVFERANQGILIADAERRMITVNEAFTRLTGLSKNDVWKKDFSIFLDQKRTSKTILDNLSMVIERGQDWEGEIYARKRNGEIFPAVLQLLAVHNEQDQIENYIGFLSDITIRKQTDERLRHLAMHDVLTGLPNRILFVDQLQNAIWRAEQTGNKVAVLFLDLDGFKSINDSMGHHVGDEFLRVIAKRLQAAIKNTDSAARIGGDEFAVLLQNIDSTKDAVNATQRLLTIISKPVSLHNQKLQTTASIGISIYPEHSTEKSLLASADQAMYEAKSRGKNSYFLFSANGKK